MTTNVSLVFISLPIQVTFYLREISFDIVQTLTVAALFAHDVYLRKINFIEQI